MKKLTVTIILLAATGAIFITGCEEEAQTNTKKSRLIAAENAQLKKDLAQCRAEIEKQKRLVEECLEEEAAIKELENNIKEITDNALADFEENMKLREENEELKSKIKEFK